MGVSIRNAILSLASSLFSLLSPSLPPHTPYPLHTSAPSPAPLRSAFPWLAWRLLPDGATPAHSAQRTETTYTTYPPTPLHYATVL